MNSEKAMRVDSLKYFLEIARLGSYSRASRHLYVSQQGLNKCIRALERELGVSLFERSGKRVHLTKAGLALVPLAKEYVDVDARLRSRMREQSEDAPPQKVAVIWAMPFITTALFSLMKDELDSRGLRRVVLEEKDYESIVSALSEPCRPAVCALVVLTDTEAASMREREDLRFEPLFCSTLGIMASDRLISPRKRSMTVEELVQLPIASYTEPVLDRLVGTLLDGLKLDEVVMHSSNLAMIYELVDAGNAVTFWDSFSWFADKGTPSRVFVEIEGAPSFHVGFAYPTGKPLPPEAADDLRRFKECIAENCALYIERHSVQEEGGER